MRQKWQLYESNDTNRLRSPPRIAIQERYQRLGNLVTDGSLSVVVEYVDPLDQCKNAITQSLRANRRGKILCKLGANDRVRATMDNGLDAEKPGFSLTRNQLEEYPCTRDRCCCRAEPISLSSRYKYRAAITPFALLCHSNLLCFTRTT